MFAATLALQLLAPAEAADADHGDTSLAVLMGTNAGFDGDPATFRLGVVGEGSLVPGGVVGLAVAVPFSWMTSGDDRFGVSTQQSVFELPPSLRLHLLDDLPVRPYADLGAGLVVRTSRTEGWLLESDSSSSGWMTRSAIGVEIGGQRGLVFVVEPLAVQTYHLGDDFTRVGGMIGLGSRF